MALLAVVLAVRALAAVAACLMVVVPGVAAYVPVLMPMSNETLCGQELHVEGAVIEPSGYEPAGGLKYFACSIKFKDIVSSRNQTSRWIVRVDRINIPYDKRQVAGRLPTIKILDHTQELAVFEYPVNASVAKQKFIAHSLSFNFINVPKMSDYRFVITLDIGDSNCTASNYHKCVDSHYCINSSLRCNHVDNCGDKSDESEELCGWTKPNETKTIIVVASFSVGLMVIVALIAIMIVFCRTKITRRKRGINRGVTYIRPPQKKDVPRVLPLTESSNDARLRRVGPGFQAAPLAMRNSQNSTNGSLPRLIALKQSQNSAPTTPRDDRYVDHNSTAAKADGCTDRASVVALLRADQLASNHRRSTGDAAAAVDSDAAEPPGAACAESHPCTSEMPLLSVRVDGHDAAQRPTSNDEEEKRAGSVAGATDHTL